MSHIEHSPITKGVPVDHRGVEGRGTSLLTVGGIFAAIAATSCCVLPLALTLLGVSGAWMGNLRALAPYQPYFIGLALLALGYGFYQVYLQPRAACADGDAWVSPLSNRIVKTGLWTGTVIVVTVVSFPIWFPVIVTYLP